VKRRPGCGCGSFILGVCILFALALGMQWLGERIDRQRFPWGYADSGGPTLAGTWVGPIRTGSGKRLAMLVEMALAPLDRGRNRSSPIIRTPRSHWLEGRALVCAAPGRIQHFTVEGKPQDTRTGSPFALAFVTADSPSVDGLAPSHLRGRWTGGDSLQLVMDLYLRRGQAAITNSADPDTGPDTPATLKRGTESEFNSLCSRLTS
jgi:hypothetical protein